MQGPTETNSKSEHTAAVFPLHVTQNTRLVTVFAHQPESKTFLAGLPDLDGLIQTYEVYAPRLFALVPFFCHCENDVKLRELIEGSLEDELDVFVSKETNKKHTQKVLEPYILHEERSAFLSQLSLI
jgi:hypothetical protein